MFNTIRDNWYSYNVCLALTSLGVFDVLADQVKSTVDKLAQIANVSPRGLQLTLPLATNLGLFNMEGDSLHWLHTPKNIAKYARLKADLFISGSDVTLETSIRTGQPTRPTDGGVVKHDLEQIAVFQQLLVVRSEEEINYTAAIVSGLLDSCVTSQPRVLDLAGGHGAYARRIVNLRENALAVVFDLASVIGVIAPKCPHINVSYQAGDYRTTTFEPIYDVILISNVLHSESSTDAQNLLRRAHEALKPGGFIILKDKIIGFQNVIPDYIKQFNIVMLTETISGYCKSANELTKWLHNLGFVDVEFRTDTCQTWDYMIARIPLDLTKPNYNQIG